MLTRALTSVEWSESPKTRTRDQQTDYLTDSILNFSFWKVPRTIAANLYIAPCLAFVQFYNSQNLSVRISVPGLSCLVYQFVYSYINFYLYDHFDAHLMKYRLQITVGDKHLKIFRIGYKNNYDTIWHRFLPISKHLKIPGIYVKNNVALFT